MTAPPDDRPPRDDGPRLGMTARAGPDGEPVFFETVADLRRWFEANHDSATELWVGMYKVGTGRASVRWPDLVDEALCFGWIDGIRRSIDEVSFKNRVTPRRPRSNWSQINIRRVGELEVEGRMQPAGRRAFEKRTPAQG